MGTTSLELPKWMPSKEDCGPTARDELIALLSSIDITKEQALQIMYFVEKAINDDC